jgi:hypothetical protein
MNGTRRRAFGPGKLDADAHQVHRNWTSLIMSLIMSAPVKSFFERTTPFTPKRGLPCSLFDLCIDDRGADIVMQSNVMQSNRLHAIEFEGGLSAPWCPSEIS